MKFLFLCSRLAGYFHHCISHLANTVPDAHVTIVSPANTAQKPFNFPEHPRIQHIDRNAFDAKTVRSTLDAKPDFVYLAGWRDPVYRQIGKSLRARVPVVIGSDRKWYGYVKQRVMANVLSRFVRQCCTHLWVPGMFQYEYARRMGFSQEQILTGLYSAANELFYDQSMDRYRQNREKVIVYIGNMWQDKGVVELVASFDEIHKSYPDWRLRLVGLGPLVDTYRNHADYVEVLGFRQPSELPSILCSAGAFCLPSYRDAWGVVVHEAACAGLPILATTAVGAIPAYVHDSYNGFRCEPRSVESLTAATRRLLSLSDSEREKFGQRSFELSKQVTPDLWVSRILCLL